MTFPFLLLLLSKSFHTAVVSVRIDSFTATPDIQLNTISERLSRKVHIDAFIIFSSGVNIIYDLC